jgi:hypothetical protein
MSSVLPMYCRKKEDNQGIGSKLRSLAAITAQLLYSVRSHLPFTTRL